ncbi:uncharacterized protein LOC128357692 [Scomber japonicus]|uniref:uncharacterized protein LOC128357692 n=1 Tax=Scomber japonicus TaxID=13676 RepID=UPI00230667E5|nr:uncharacterized protein LOC128357692 [Scomber japonicus]
MNIHPVLLFCFLSVLQDGNIGLINAEIPIFTRTEGQNITVQCNFTETGSKKYFCKHISDDRITPDLYNDCDGDERILEMNGHSAQRGRYSMRYETRRTGSRLYVTITHLTKSDSGRYGCGLDISLSKDPYQEFKIFVTDAPSTSKPKWTPKPLLTSASTTTQNFRRSSTPSTFSAQTTNQSEQKQTETTTSGSSGNILYPAVTLIVVVVLLAVFLPLLYKWKKRRSSNHLNSRGRVTDTNMESVIYDNCAPVSKLEECDYENNPSSTYETLNPTTMADQTYSTLGQPI